VPAGSGKSSVHPFIKGRLPTLPRAPNPSPSLEKALSGQLLMRSCNGHLVAYQPLLEDTVFPEREDLYEPWPAWPSTEMGCVPPDAIKARTQGSAENKVPTYLSTSALTEDLALFRKFVSHHHRAEDVMQIDINRRALAGLFTEVDAQC
jgi:hypothetical protein